MIEVVAVYDAGVRRSTIGSFASKLVGIYRLWNIEIFLAVTREVVVKCGRTVPNTELRLTSAKPGYLMGQYIQTI